MNKAASSGNTTSLSTKKFPSSTQKGSNSRDQSNNAQQASHKVPSRDKGKSQSNQKLRNTHGQGDNPTRVANETGAQPRKQKTNKPERTAKAGTKTSGKTDPATVSQKKGKTKPASSKSRSKAQKKGSASSAQSAEARSKASAEDDLSGQTPKASSPPLRPPPGLAPPPGFGQEPQNELAPLSISAGGGQPGLGPMLTAVLSNPDLTLTGSSPSAALPFSKVSTGRSDLLFTGNIGETRPESSYEPSATLATDSKMPFPVHASPPMTGLGANSEGIGLGQGGYTEQMSPSTTPINALLDNRNTSQNGFDVMDFLDSILNDGGPAEQESEDPGMLLAGGSDAPLLSNPWASEGKSRAAAYGISFDNADDMSSEASPILDVRAATPTDEGSAFGNIPLLTPAAILLSGQDDEGNDEDRAQSFYTSLMGED